MLKKKSAHDCFLYPSSLFIPKRISHNVGKCIVFSSTCRPTATVLEFVLINNTCIQYKF